MNNKKTTKVLGQTVFIWFITTTLLVAATSSYIAMWHRRELKNIFQED